MTRSQISAASDAEVAWLAGLLEGEGTFSSWAHSSQYVYPCVQIQMTDRDVIERAQRLIGAKSLRVIPGRQANHQTTYLVRVQGWPALDVMAAIRPWMGERRGAKLDELMASYENRPRSDGLATHCRRGHEMTPENTYTYPNGGRQCVQCRRAYSGATSSVRGARGRFPQLHNEDWLRAEYEVAGKSIYAIGSDLGCSPVSVYEALKRNNIERRPVGRRSKSTTIGV